LTLQRAYRGQIQVDVVDGKLRAVDHRGARAVTSTASCRPRCPRRGRRRRSTRRRSPLGPMRWRRGRSAPPYDAYSDTRSQMYLGISAEVGHDIRSSGCDEGAGCSPSAARSRRRFFYSTSGGRDRVEHRLDGNCASVSCLGPRPVRHHLAVPQLGPGAGNGADNQQGAQGGRSDHRRDNDEECRRPRRQAHAPDAARAVDGGGGGAALGDRACRSTWFTVGVMSLQAPVACCAAAVRPCRSRSPARCAESRASTLEQRVTGGTLGAGRPRCSRLSEADPAADDHDRLPPCDDDSWRAPSFAFA